MKRIKLSAAVMAVILMTSTFALTSCKRGEQVPLNEIKYVEEGTPWYDMIKVEMDLEAYGTGFVEPDVLVYNDDYFTCIVQGWVDGGDDINCIEQRDYNGNLLCRINIQDQIGDSYSCYMDRAGGYSVNGKDYIALNINDEETWEPHAFIFEIDYDGERLINPQEIDIHGLIGDAYNLLEVSLAGDYIVYRTQNFNLDCKMLVVNQVTGESYVADIDSGDHSFFWVTPTNTVGGRFDGDIYYAVEREEDSVCYGFNPETGVVTETATSCDPFQDLILPDASIIYKDGSCLTKTTIGSDDKEVLMDLTNSAVSPANYIMMELCAYTDEHILFTCQDISNSQGYQTRFFYILNKAETNPHVGKQIVTIGSFFDISMEMGQLIEKNNGSDSDYFIIVTDKYNWWNYVDNSLADEERTESIRQAPLIVQDMLIRDVANGEGPDVLIGFGRVCAYTPDLIYEDLTPWVNGDNGLNRDEFIDIVFSGSKDGNIYQIPFGVQMEGLEVPADLGDLDLDLEGMTYAEYIDFINHHFDGVDAIFAQDTSYGYAPDDIEYFMKLWSFQACDYIDDGRFNITTGENAEEFRQLADFVANRDVNFCEAEDSGKTILINERHWNNFYYYFSESYGRVRNTVGYPSFGGITPFSNSYSPNTIAMTKCCADKDAAWNIIRQMFDYDIQSTFMDGNIPVNIQALEYVCDRSIEFISNGTSSTYINWDYSGVDYSLWKNQFIEDVSTMNILVMEDQMVNQILREELPAYFEGQKSIEDVAAVIENRVNTYLQENR